MILWFIIKIYLVGVILMLLIMEVCSIIEYDFCLDDLKVNLRFCWFSWPGIVLMILGYYYTKKQEKK